MSNLLKSVRSAFLATNVERKLLLTRRAAAACRKGDSKPVSSGSLLPWSAREGLICQSVYGQNMCPNVASVHKRAGDYDTHNGLWEMCEKTAHDMLIRMALVPRVLEARGLDVTPGIQKKLTQAGDHNAVTLLDIILRDEIGHVETGNHWFRYCCRERGLKPEPTFFQLLDESYPKGLMGPFNLGRAKRRAFRIGKLPF